VLTVNLPVKITRDRLMQQTPFQNRDDQPVELDGLDLTTHVGPVVIDIVKISGPERTLDGGAFVILPNGPSLSDLEPLVGVDGAVIRPEPTRRSYLVVLVVRVTERGIVDVAGARLRYHQGNKEYVLEIPGSLEVCASRSLFESECRHPQ
jgi:hypothetical protein